MITWPWPGDKLQFHSDHNKYRLIGEGIITYFYKKDGKYIYTVKLEKDLGEFKVGEELVVKEDEVISYSCVNPISEG